MSYASRAYRIFPIIHAANCS